MSTRMPAPAEGDVESPAVLEAASTVLEVIRAGQEGPALATLRDLAGDVRRKVAPYLWEAAVELGSTNMLECLLESGVNVDRANAFGTTGLMAAAELGEDEVVAFLLRHGASVNVVDQGGESALVFACAVEHPQILSLLLAHGADPNGGPVSEHLYVTPLIRQLGHRDLLGALPNGERHDSQRQLEAVKVLVQHGADVNRMDRLGARPLAVASEPRLVSYLISKGANPNLTDSQGLTPIMSWAGCSYDPELAQRITLLVRAGGKLNVRDKEGKTALHYAYDSRVRELLLALGASPHIKDKNGNLP